MNRDQDAICKLTGEVERLEAELKVLREALGSVSFILGGSVTVEPFVRIKTIVNEALQEGE